MSNPSLLDIPLQRIDGQPSSLADFKGKVLLLVNVASQCGLTPQYEGLQKLYSTYRGRGLEVLGFPANEFGAQEPGTNDEIRDFCTSKFGVDFPMFAKIVVKGPGIHPLYRALVEALPTADALGDTSFREKLAQYGIQQEAPSDVLWNFEKFLVSRDGKVIARFAPNVAPDHAGLLSAIEAAL